MKASTKNENLIEGLITIKKLESDNPVAGEYLAKELISLNNDFISKAHFIADIYGVSRNELVSLATSSLRLYNEEHKEPSIISTLLLIGKEIY